MAGGRLGAGQNRYHGYLVAKVRAGHNALQPHTGPPVLAGPSRELQGPVLVLQISVLVFLKCESAVQTSTRFVAVVSLLAHLTWLLL